MTAMIDVHAHWRPAEVADALRARSREPRIVRDQDGVEVLKSRMSEEPLAKAFDDVDFHLGRMDRQGVETSVLSLVGGFCWIESQPLDVSVPLCRRVNDGFSAICEKHPGRFAAFAALPLTDVTAAAAELERALALPGVVGAQLPGNYFLTRTDAEAARLITSDIDEADRPFITGERTEEGFYRLKGGFEAAIASRNPRRQQAFSILTKRLPGADVHEQRAFWMMKKGDPAFAALQPGRWRHEQRAFVFAGQDFFKRVFFLAGRNYQWDARANDDFCRLYF